MSDFRPTAYLRPGCPFSLKFLVYITEAGLLGQVDWKAIAPGAEYSQNTYDMLATHVEKVSFPMVEIEPGVFMADSDQLIAHFKKVSGTEAQPTPVLDFYIGGVYAEYLRLYMGQANREPQPD